VIHDSHPITRQTRRAIAVLAAVLVLCVVGEGLFRSLLNHAVAQRGRAAFDAMLPVKQLIRVQQQADGSAFAADPDLGALQAPGLSDVIETPEYTYRFQTDHAGFPNRDPWPSEVQIAVLGDSLLTGPGVGFDGQFTTLLASELGGRRLVNLAVPGGGTEQEYRSYRKFVARLHPKLVIAILWLTWDIDNSLRFDRWLSEKSTMDFTQFREAFGDSHSGEQGAAPSRVAQLGAAAREFLSRSYLLQAIYLRITGSGEQSGPIERVALPSGGTVLLSARDERRLAQGLERPGAPDVRDLFFRPLMRLQNEVESDGGKFVIVLIPSKEEIYAAEAYPQVLRPWQDVKAELEARRLPTLDLYPVLRNSGRDGGPPFFRVDSHLNEYGNQVVADALAQWITEQKIFPPEAGG